MTRNRLRLARPSASLARSIRGSAAYAVAAVVQRSLGFLLLPIYARSLDPTEYGQVALVLTVSAAVSALWSLGLETAMFRTFALLASDPQDQRRFLNSVGIVGLIAPSCLAFVIFLTLGGPVESAFRIPRDVVGVALLGAAIQTSIIVVPMAVLRAQERLRDYLRLTALQGGSTALLTVVLVVGLGWGIRGWFLASLISAVVVLGGGLAVLGHRWRPVIDRGHVLAALGFGLPLLPHALAHWGLSVSDRVILGAYLPASDVGLYYVAYQFALPLGALATAIHLGVMPQYARAAASDAHLKDLGGIVTHQILLTAIFGFGAAVLGPPMVRLLLPAQYAGAAEYVPWIALGYTLFGLYLIPMDAVSVTAGKTRWVWLVTVPAALGNVLLNLFTVPRFGAIAAAVNTAVGYAILLVGIFVYMRMTVVRRPSPRWSHVLPSVVSILLVAVAVVVIGRGQSAGTALLLGLAALVAIPIVLVASGIWRVSDNNVAASVG